jgi:glycosyltransferase involved in cell wall biosynthesis
MKVALLGIKGDFSPDSGAGIQRYMFELYTNLAKITKDIDKVEFKPIKLIGNGLSFALETFFADLSNYNILHNLMPVPFLGNVKSRNILITTAHDFQTILYPQFTFDHGVTLMDKLWLMLVINPGIKRALSSDYLICDSTQTKDEAIKLGFDKDKIFVINLGVDKRFFEPITKKRGRSIFTVGYLGALRKRKNLEFGIIAANLISDRNIFFDIWGKKEYEYEYLKSIEKNKNIKFKGFAPENKIVNIYDSFDVFIFPSLHEGLGLPILEAQARGLPVIIYKYGKIPKEVRKYCLEAESPEHMAQIIEHIKENGYNEKERKKAMEYARSFTWEKTARETLEVYKKVLE